MKNEVKSTAKKYIVNTYNSLFIDTIYYQIIIFLCLIIHTLQSKKSAAEKSRKKGENLRNLKQELDIDFHTITLHELYQRFQTNPDTVSIFSIVTFLFAVLLFYKSIFFYNKGLKQCESKGKSAT